MSDNKKYYYLKLKEGFFDSEDMKLLQAMKDGYIYSDILLKLYLRSLRQEGRLMYRDIIPYTPDMIATITNHQVGTVEKAIKILEQMGFIEILDNGAIYMTDIQNFIGQSSNEADRKRRYRSYINAEKSRLLMDNRETFVGTDNGQTSGQMSDNRPPEYRDKSIENRDYIKESEREKNGAHFYGRYNNVILTDKELQMLKEDFPSDYQSMIEHLSEYMASYGKTYKNHLATMELWKKADMKKEQGTGRGYSYNGSFEEGDSL